MADTVITQPKYGCHNRQLKTSYQTLVRDRDSSGNLIGHKTITIINTMSHDCHYDLREEDSKCSGCKWIDYIPAPF